MSGRLSNLNVHKGLPAYLSASINDSGSRFIGDSDFSNSVFVFNNKIWDTVGIENHTSDSNFVTPTFLNNASTFLINSNIEYHSNLVYYYNPIFVYNKNILRSGISASTAYSTANTVYQYTLNPGIYSIFIQAPGAGGTTGNVYNTEVSPRVIIGGNGGGSGGILYGKLCIPDDSNIYSIYISLGEPGSKCHPDISTATDYYDYCTYDSSERPLWAGHASKTEFILSKYSGSSTTTLLDITLSGATAGVELSSYGLTSTGNNYRFYSKGGASSLDKQNTLNQIQYQYSQGISYSTLANNFVSNNFSKYIRTTGYGSHISTVKAADDITVSSYNSANFYNDGILYSSDILKIIAVPGAKGGTNNFVCDVTTGSPYWQDDIEIPSYNSDEYNNRTKCGYSSLWYDTSTKIELSGEQIYPAISGINSFSYSVIPYLYTNDVYNKVYDKVATNGLNVYNEFSGDSSSKHLNLGGIGGQSTYGSPYMFSEEYHGSSNFGVRTNNTAAGYGYGGSGGALSRTAEDGSSYGHDGGKGFFLFAIKKRISNYC
jgi:hypothetical protein